ncbi:MAG: Membrane-bound lytic murein transglycosylase B precursor [Parcubacteria group bacterium ADurb.Bin159]|nr:MAG: Membrane-bound lytic murein transglycosylase B precursor [Parcubacteria group bacterium ADurb.Bin159]
MKHLKSSKLWDCQSFWLIFFWAGFLVILSFQEPYWRAGKQYADIIKELRELGFSDKQIDSIFSDPRIRLHPDLVQKSKGVNVPSLISSNSRLLSQESVARGKKFLEENREFLEKIESKYGVEKEAIVAILRIETDFGKYLGEYYAFNIFNSVVFYTDSGFYRYEWAKKELISLIKLSQLSQREKFDYLGIRSSSAGAIGLAQFLPSSYLQFAVDGNGDGKINLFEVEDSIESIANYLKESGWQKNRNKAIWRYNPDEHYVEGVNVYAQKLKEADK